MKKVAGKLKLSLAQFRELEAFAQFGSDLDSATQEQLNLGRRLNEVLKQPQYSPVPIANQVAILYAVTNGYLNDIPVENIGDFEAKFHDYLASQGRDIIKAINDKKELSEDTEAKLKTLIEEFKQSYT